MRWLRSQRRPTTPKTANSASSSPRSSGDRARARAGLPGGPPHDECPRHSVRDHGGHARAAKARRRRSRSRPCSGSRRAQRRTHRYWTAAVASRSRSKGDSTTIRRRSRASRPCSSLRRRHGDRAGRDRPRGRAIAASARRAARRTAADHGSRRTPRDQRRRDRFVMEPGFRISTRRRKGQLLARDARGEIRAPSDGIVILPLTRRAGTTGSSGAAKSPWSATPPRPSHRSRRRPEARAKDLGQLAERGGEMATAVARSARSFGGASAKRRGAPRTVRDGSRPQRRSGGAA